MEAAAEAAAGGEEVVATMAGAGDAQGDLLARGVGGSELAAQGLAKVLPAAPSEVRRGALWVVLWVVRQVEFQAAQMV